MDEPTPGDEAEPVDGAGGRRLRKAMLLAMGDTRLTVVLGGRARHLLVRGRGTWAEVRQRARIDEGSRDWWVTPWPGAEPEPLSPDRPVGEHPLVDGAQLHPPPPRRVPVRPRAPVRIVVSSGPDAGRWLDLRPGSEVSVGRDPAADLRLRDPRVSRHHLTVTTARGGVVLADQGSTNGTWVDGDRVTGSSSWRPDCTVRIGSSRLLLTEVGPDPSPGQPVERRVSRPAPDPDTTIPAVELRTPAMSPPAAPTGMPVLAWLIPLLISVTLAAVLRMPYLLLFGLMAPATSLGSYIADRRRHRRETAEAISRHRADVERLRSEAERARAVERAAREARTPATGLVLARLQAGDLGALWSRSTADDGGIPVRLGSGEVSSRVVLDGARLRLSGAPVEVDLRNGVTIRGPFGSTRGLARSLLCQAVLHHPPGDVAVEPVDGPTRGPAWAWLPWLPHHGVPGRATLRLTESVTDGQLEVRFAVDGEHREVLVEIDDEGALTVPGSGSCLGSCTPDLVAPDVALTLARTLTSVRWQGEGGTVGGTSATFRDLHPTPDAATLTALWQRRPRSTRFTLGSASSGPVTLDLAVDGPHVLVGGTTGSGKSELLRSLVTSLATGNRPDELGFVLVDYKGGSAFGDCALLPHTRAVVTDLDPHLADRALRSLTAELKRRERLLAAAGARDLAAYQRGDGTDLPRLVLVIDEFRALAQELPSFLEGLVRVAALGRSLGVHVVLATQRPAGIVSADIRANVNLRISLRVRDESDSRDILDTGAAARLPEREPGHALVRTGSDPPRALRVASVSQPDDGRDTGPWVRWFDSPWELDTGSEGAAEAGSAGGVAEQEGTYLQDLSAAARTAAADLACRVVPPPWLPPLPDVVDLAELAGPSPGTTSPVPPVPVGLLDLPESQEQTSLTWSPTEDGNLLVIGAPRSGRSTTARTVVAGLLGAAVPPPQLYGFDPAGALAPLADLTTTGAWVGADETARGARVVEVLAELVEQRRRRLAAAGRSSFIEHVRHDDEAMPLAVVVVDDWASFVAAYGEVDRGRVLDRLVQVLREGPTVGLVAVVTGDRSLLTSRLTSAAGQTWCLRMTDPHDLLLTGLRAGQVPERMPPGRVVRVADAGVAQVAVLGGVPDGGSQLARLADLVRDLPAPTEVGAAPPQVRPLPARVGADALVPTCAPGLSTPEPETRGPLLLGVGGDDARPHGLPARGGLWVVAGPPGSGRSTTLATIAHQARRRGLEVVQVGPQSGPPRAREPACVLVDDVERLVDTPVEDELLAYAGAVQDRGGLVVLAGEPDRLAGTFRGIVPVVARARTGVLLQPRAAADGAVLGVDVPVPDSPLPGRGLLVERGRVLCRMQVALPEVAPVSPAGPSR